MAWVDDRIYCHPKVLKVSKTARWTWVASIAFSSGWSTKGRLAPGEQEAIGSNAKVRAELVKSGLWESVGDEGDVLIHDWDEHNGKRDERREKDRDRKREARKSWRASAGTSAGHSNGTSAGQTGGASPAASTVAAHVDGSDGSDGSEEKQGTSKSHLEALPYTPRESTISEHLWNQLAKAAKARTPLAINKLARTVQAHHSTEADVVCAIEAATGSGVRDPLAVALSELVKRAA